MTQPAVKSEDDAAVPVLDRWRRQFERTRPSYVSFTKRMHLLLEEIFDQRGIVIDRIESRTKTAESFFEKVQRDGKSYGDPFAEMKDICGLRIVPLFTADAEKIAPILKEEFAIDAVNSIDKGAELEPDRFGYQSIHSIVSLSPARAALTEWSNYAGFKAEIQVRTVLQHAWAAINHSLAYKATGDIPKPMIRRLNRISALLESADDEFLALQQEMSQHRAATVTAVESGKRGIGIDAQSLDVYFETSGAAETWDNLAYSAGYEISHKSSVVELARRNLLSVLEQAEIKTLDDLGSALEELQPRAPGFLRTIRQGWQERTGSARRPVANWYAIVRIAVLFHIAPALAQKILQGTAFGADMSQIIRDVLRTSDEGKSRPEPESQQSVADSQQCVNEQESSNKTLDAGETERRWQERN